MPQFTTINKDVSTHDINSGLWYLTFDSCCNWESLLLCCSKTEIVDISVRVFNKIVLNRLNWNLKRSNRRFHSFEVATYHQVTALIEMAWQIKEGTSVTYIKLFLCNGLTNKRGHHWLISNFSWVMVWPIKENISDLYQASLE